MAHDIEKKWRSKDVLILENADFNSMLLCDRVLSGLAKAGFKKPSPIQLEAIPTGRFGKDLLVQAKSGTGKTLVFVIVALEMLHRKLFRPQVLIIVPTREIATQICSVIKTVGSYFPKLTCESFIGGFSVDNDIVKIHNCQIIVGTPGRIKQLIDLKALRTNSIRLVVFDEADQLLTFSLQDDIDGIFNSLPEDKQVIATSATYPPKLKKIMFKYLRDPYLACFDSRKLALIGIIHYAKIIESSAMPVRQYNFKLEALEPILKNIKFAQCLVYCNGIHKVETLYRDIRKWGFSTTYISSNRDQSERLKAIDCLKRFKCKVLVSSDVTARGIDAENVDLVVNFDISNCAETYLHRSGRAGRYGTMGVTITIVDGYELKFLKLIEKEARFKSYLLPDPVPFDLIQNPSLEKYAIEVSEEEIEEKSVALTKKEIDELSESKKHVLKKGNVEQHETQAKCLPNSISDNCGADSEKQVGIFKNTFEGESSFTNDANENHPLIHEIKSQVLFLENVKSFMNGNSKDVNIQEDLNESTDTKNIYQTEVLNNSIPILNFNVPKGSESLDGTSGNKGFNSPVLSECSNSGVSNSMPNCQDIELELTILNECKNLEVRNEFPLENDCVISTNVKLSNINGIDSKEFPFESVKNQYIESCLEDDLSNLCISELDGSSYRNKISHGIATFVQKYETSKNMESVTSESANNLADKKSPLPENSGKKSVLTSSISDLNSRRSDYYYEVFKLFQEGNTHGNNENLNELPVDISIEDELCIEKNIFSSEVSSGENAPSIQKVSEEPSSVVAFNTALEFTKKHESSKDFADSPVSKSSSSVHVDVSNCFQSADQESTPYFDKSKYKVSALFDRCTLEQPKTNSVAFFDEISEEYDSETESDVKVSLKASYSSPSEDSESDSKSCSDSSDSCSLTSSSSDDEKYVDDRESLYGSQGESLDSSSTQSIMYDKKTRFLKKHAYSADKTSTNWKRNQHSHYTRYVNAYQQPCHSSHVNAYQQSHNCSHSNAYQQPHYSAYPNPENSSFSSMHYHPHHPTGSKCKRDISRKKHNAVNRNADKAKNYQCHSSGSKHFVECFMPSEHRCHPYNDSIFCNQREICAQWYRMFYNQWLHIQRCCSFTS